MNNHKLTIRTNILNPVSPLQAELLPDYIITIDKGRIASIVPASMEQRCDVEAGGWLAIPGMIDMHVHLSQYRIRGMHKPALLPWLNDYVFPEEAQSANYDYAYQLADAFFTALYKHGTTTAVIYTAPYVAACEAAFQVAQLHTYRAFIGMTLMNQNCHPDLMQDTEAVMADTLDLIKKHHHPEEGRQYILTPRFAPTCSMDLMRWIAGVAKEQNLWIQTHLSENKDEIRWTKQLFQSGTYTEIYETAGLLTPKTLLAHCLHLVDTEWRMLNSCGCKAVHCPDSNFYLQSGALSMKNIRLFDVPYALGSDVGAGTDLNMLYHAKLAIYTQQVNGVSPAEAFYRITLGSANLLNLADRIGSLESGKDADLVLLKPQEALPGTADELLSKLIFTHQDWQIEQVYAQGIRQV